MSIDSEAAKSIVYQFISLDLPPLIASIFSAISCALLGSYLILRKQSLMGDAISHSVLPGIVTAFLLSGSRGTLPVFLGAAIAGVLSAFLIDLIRRAANVDESASMGVVFSTFFALGILTMEQAAARNIDLDADCLLHGQLETIFWYPPTDWSSILDLKILSEIPSEVYISVGTTAIIVIFISLMWKELLISSFDPALSSALGFKAGLINPVLMIILAFAVVASFKTVGSILVIALLICPPATARLLTDRLSTQLTLSAIIGAISAILGYFIAAFGPTLLGFNYSLNAAGMIALLSGVILAAGIVFSPSYGLISSYKKKVTVYSDDFPPH